MKKINVVLGLLLVFLCASCGYKTSDISIAPLYAADTTAATSTTAVTGTAPAPSEIEKRATDAYQEARKNATKPVQKAVVKK